MNRFSPLSPLIATVAVVFALPNFARADLDSLLKQIELPPGFRISVYANGLENARSMALSPNGTLFVGTRSANNVYAVRDNDGDDRAETRYTILGPGKLPDGSLLVSDDQVGAIYRITYGEV